MQRVLWSVPCVLAIAAVATACGFYFDEPEKKPDKDAVKKMMIALHKGDKAPLARTGAELKKDTPDWEQLTKDAKSFTEMSEMVKKNTQGYRSPELYISSVAALSKAAKDKDHKAANKAFEGLNKSCASCHFYKGTEK